MRRLQGTPDDVLTGAERELTDELYLRPPPVKSRREPRGIGPWRDFEGKTLEEWRAEQAEAGS